MTDYNLSSYQLEEIVNELLPQKKLDLLKEINNSARMKKYDSLIKNYVAKHKEMFGDDNTAHMLSYLIKTEMIRKYC